MSGDTGFDILSGGDGNDTLVSATTSGGTGADAMAGGTGDDVYYAAALDAITENLNEGSDTVVLSTNATLPGNCEVLILIGAATSGTSTPAGATIYANPIADSTLTGDIGNDVLVGMGADDTLLGGAGNDSLIAGAGADTLAGGAGDDIYWVNSTTQSLTEQPNEGADTLATSVGGILPANIETMVLWQTGTLGVGNADDNILFGNALVASTLDGRAGNDIVIGRDGADTIIGGSGDDQLNGNAGADLFQFEQVDFGNDLIVGFSGASGDGDQIDLRGWGFNSFADIPITSTPDGQVITAGANTILLDQFFSLTAADVLN